MSPDSPAPPARIWLGYALLALLCWVLYAAAGTDWVRGTRTIWDGLYDATWNLGPPLLMGPLVLPWMKRVQRWRLLRRLGLHLLGALAFAAVWLLLDYSVALWFFGPLHAQASLEQGLVLRVAWGVLIYSALVFGFGGVLHARAAQAAALRAAQAEAARVQAELAAVSSKLNPHFLFNTLNSLLLLTRKDPGAAEAALLAFARLMRYALEATRQTRVSLREELDFVRDYLQLEALRLGDRLRQDWQIDETLLDEELPPLSLQPLVENAVLHGIAPQVGGGCLRISAARGSGQLLLRVADDGPGCNWPPEAAAAPSGRKPRGIGLSALQRRFELDYEGRARLEVHTRPGAGFAVHLSIPLT